MNVRQAGRTFLTAETFDGQTAVANGLITHLAPAGLLDAVVEAVLDSLRGCERQSLAATKRLLNADVLMFFDGRADEMVALSAELFGSEIARRHLEAFVR